MSDRQQITPATFGVEVVVAESGERLPLVVCKGSGLPLFSPAVWLTAHRRCSGFSSGTLANNAHTLASMYVWAEARGIDLAERFDAGNFLCSWEVDDLSDFLRVEIKTQSKRSNIQRFRQFEPSREPKVAAVVTPGVGNYRIDIAASYLYWLATESIHHFRNAGRKSNAEESERHRDEMVAKLRGHKQISRGRNAMQLRMAPESAAMARLLEVVSVDHPQNPWADPPILVDALENAKMSGDQKEVSRLRDMLRGKLAIRLRNRLIVHLLYHLGLRRGEMLGLKARDLKGQFLLVLRHPDDPEDPRKYQPNTKTRDRKLPVNPGLQVMWLDYVSLVRSKFPMARKHPFLIVNHRDGAPLSFPGLAKVFYDLRMTEGLPKDLTPHHLRHAWNEEFSRLADEQGLDPAREVQLRAELMGWNPGSPRPTAMIYLRRHTKRKAQEISLQLQGEMMHPRGSHGD